MTQAAGGGRPPTVSVIVPTFDRRPLLEQAVASVLGQSFADLELVVVDDGSRDGSAEFVRSLPDPRVRLLELPHSGSVARLRNAGAAAAEGEWLCFLDSDDLWDAAKLQRQLHGTRAAGTRWSYTRYELMDEEGARLAWVAGGSDTLSGWVARPLLTDALGVVICTVMVERALFRELGGFDERLRNRQDYELVVRLALRAPVHGVDEPLVRVRHHVGRTTTLQPPERVLLSAAEAFRVLMPHLPPGLRRIARRRRALHLADAGARLMKKGRLREAAGCFARSAAGGAGVRRLVAALARGVR